VHGHRDTVDASVLEDQRGQPIRNRLDQVVALRGDEIVNSLRQAPVIERIGEVVRSARCSEIQGGADVYAKELFIPFLGFEDAVSRPDLDTG
jgi:hypothetical protein